MAPVLRWSYGAAWVGLLTLFVAVAVQRLWSADTWTLLSIGRWVVEHRGWPRVEEWTWTGAGHQWIELRWLFCVPMELAFTRVGEWAPSVIAGGLVGLAVVVLGGRACRGRGLAIGVLVWRSRRVMGEPLAVLVVALGLVEGMTRWVMRPELVTYAMV